MDLQNLHLGRPEIISDVRQLDTGGIPSAYALMGGGRSKPTLSSEICLAYRETGVPPTTIYL
jgi:hypothetical protein